MGWAPLLRLNTASIHTRKSTAKFMKVLYTEGQLVQENELLLHNRSDSPFQAMLVHPAHRPTLIRDQALLKDAQLKPRSVSRSC